MLKPSAPPSARSGKHAPASDEPLPLLSVPARPAGSAPATSPWRHLLRQRLRERALPALVTGGVITPAASIWTGARLWCAAFRGKGLRPGDRLVLALPPSAAFVQVLIAALWDGLTIVPVRPTESVDDVLDQVAARGAVTTQQHPHAWMPDGPAGPLHEPEQLAFSSQPPTPDARFLLRTSGTTGARRWVALSDLNVAAVLGSHLPHLGLTESRVLSVLPWTHAFGLLLDLLPAILSGAEIIRDEAGGRDPERLLALYSTWEPTHLSAVPLTIRKLTELDAGTALLQQLQGGIVGGAPVAADLAEVLRTTRLRAGYGQTEAAPGIALGAPGDWHANYLGRAVGCRVWINEEGELAFKGRNACLGYWQHGHLNRLAPDRWVTTGDLATSKDGDLFFRGRVDDAFKLSNGRHVRAGFWESQLIEQLPVLRDVMLYPVDGQHLAVALLLRRNTTPPDAALLRASLGSLGKKLTEVRVLRDDDWIRTPKGALARRAMLDVLRPAPHDVSIPSGA